jgi:hypothetical protein
VAKSVGFSEVRQEHENPEDAEGEAVPEEEDEAFVVVVVLKSVVMVKGNAL